MLNKIKFAAVAAVASAAFSIAVLPASAGRLDVEPWQLQGVSQDGQSAGVDATTTQSIRTEADRDRSGSEDADLPRRGQDHLFGANSR